MRNPCLSTLLAAVNLCIFLALPLCQGGKGEKGSHPTDPSPLILLSRGGEGRKTKLSGSILELLEGFGSAEPQGQGKSWRIKKLPERDADPDQQERAGVGWRALGSNTRGRFLINCLISFSLKRSDSYPSGVNRNVRDGFWPQDFRHQLQFNIKIILILILTTSASLLPPELWLISVSTVTPFWLLHQGHRLAQGALSCSSTP